MAYTYHELAAKTVAELRDIAKGIEHDAVRGYTQMNKERLLPAICSALGVEMHEQHQAVGINKAELKARMRDLKRQRAKALETHDSGQLKSIRRHIHRLNRQIRAHTV
jgi:hypothetical protein